MLQRCLPLNGGSLRSAGFLPAYARPGSARIAPELTGIRAGRFVSAICRLDFRGLSRPLSPPQKIAFPGGGDSPTIALVDDDHNVLSLVSIALKAEGYRVATYTDGASALDGFQIERLRAKRPLVNSGCQLSAPMADFSHAVGAEAYFDAASQITHPFWLYRPGARPIGAYVLAAPPCGVHKRPIAAPPMYP
jgi:hypothetical protein